MVQPDRPHPGGADGSYGGHTGDQLDRLDHLDEVSAEALRRLAAMVGDRIQPAAYTDIVVDFLAGEALADQPRRAASADDVGAAADELLASLPGVLLVETARRQGNRPFPGSRHVAD